MSRKLLGACVVVVLAGCATDRVPPDVASRIKRIAPIAMVGDVFERRFDASVIFLDEYDKKDISHWKIDAAYEQQLGSAAERMLGVIVSRPKYSVEEFAHVNDLVTWKEDLLRFESRRNPNWRKIEAPARAYCSANSLDALLVVAKMRRGGGRGIGSVARARIYTWAAPGLRRSELHVFAVIGLIDCRDGKKVASHTLEMSRDPAAGYMLPVTDLRMKIARTPISQWTPETDDRVRAAAIALPGRAWVDTLRSLFGYQQ
jgi:hypothetical protein